MNVFRSLSFLLLLLIIASCTLNQDQITTINNTALLQTAKTLPNYGTLKIARDHYVYLRVSDDFETKLFPLLVKGLQSNEIVCLKPDHNKRGAHVTLFYEHQLMPKQLFSLPVNHQFYFQISQLEKVPKKNFRTHSYIIWYVLRIDSPELDGLRKKYIGLNNLPLHISIAVARYRADGHCAYRRY